MYVTTRMGIMQLTIKCYIVSCYVFLMFCKIRFALNGSGISRVTSTWMYTAAAYMYM